MVYIPEAEAHNYICPFMLAVNADTPVNRYCMGKGCVMAWRWYTETLGYCGIAGKPELVAIVEAPPPLEPEDE